MSDSNKKKTRHPELHKDHRKRVKEKFRETGLSGFHDHNVLEMLLFYSIPRCDTNEFAHLLINEFGSFDAVLDAPIDALTKVEGIGLESATLINFIPAICRYYLESKVRDKIDVKSSEDATTIFRPYFSNATAEKFVVMYLNGKSGLLKCTEYTQNESSMVYTDFKAIINEAALLDAKGIVIAHNHPNGFATPSQSDIMLTEMLSSVCTTLGIHLCDHIIFSGSDICYCSRRPGFKNCKFVF